MEGQSQLYTVASVIGIIVIFAMAACFAILFSVYANQRIKNIRGGLDDENLGKDLDRMMNRYLDHSFNSYRRKATSVRDRNAEPQFPAPNSKVEDGLYVASLKDAQRGSTVLVRIGNVLYVVFIVLCLALAGFGIYMNSSDQPIFINNTSYIVIMTGSMEEKNPDNEYLLENDLDDQITQYSLIGIEHTDFDAVENYDVIAFYDSDHNIIVHRVIAIHEDNGERTLQTRGDSNNASIDDEMAITEEEFIGTYSGFQNYGLGITITYLRSTLGIIALCGFGLFLLAYSIADGKIDKAYQERIGGIAKKWDYSK